MSTADDITTRVFSTTFVGYDRAEVDAFRDEVAALVADLRGRVAALERQLNDYEHSKPITADQAFAHVARETQRILQAAQDAGARMVQQAREQAENELAMARREHSAIVGEGYRAREKMGEQLSQLDEARARLLQKLYDASSEIERICAAVEADPPTDVRRAVSEQIVEHSRTGTDLARRPTRPGEPALRVVGEDGQQRPVRPRGTVRDGGGKVRGGDAVADKRDALAPLRTAMVDGLRAQLNLVRDRLREHLRQAGEVKPHGEIVLDEAALSGAVEVADQLLARAYQLGARAAAEHDGSEPAELGDALDGVMAEVLDARVAAHIRTLLEHGRAAQEPPWVIAERVDSAMADVTEAMVAEIAETELSRAYERGKLATWTKGSVARRWIMSPRGHRRDDRCRQNVAAGAVPPAEPFPSGDHAPPRFAGCTCTTTAVAKEDNEP